MGPWPKIEHWRALRDEPGPESQVAFDALIAVVLHPPRGFRRPGIAGQRCLRVRPREHIEWLHPHAPQRSERAIS